MKYEKPEMEVLNFGKDVMAMNIDPSGEPDGSSTGEQGDPTTGEW